MAEGAVVKPVARRPTPMGVRVNVNTADIDSAFFPRLEEVADEVDATPRDLMAVWYSESGVKAMACNPNGFASGIYQAMPATLMGLGWSRGHAAYRTLTATAQLEWALRYYRPYRGYLVSIGAVYTATFLPALLKHAGDPGFILTAKDGPLGWAYSPNAVFDANRDYAITVGELEDAVRRNCRGPRWAELVARLDGSVIDTDADDCDLGTTRGLQAALRRLGYDPGAVDGLPGPKTTAAVVAFQQSNGLKADSIYGPNTRQRLAIALATT